MADSTTLLAGLPDAWQAAFASRLSAPDTTVVTIDGTDTTALQESHAVTTVVISALTAPPATSLDDALTALEHAVELNDFQPIQLLTAIADGMMSRQAGRILLITFDPRALTSPQDAPARGSARGILTYFESLRPALKQRGVHVGILLVAPKKLSQWNSADAAETLAAVVMDCLKKSTLQRTLTVK